MAQTRVLGWKGQHSSFMPKQPRHRAGRIDALFDMVRLGGARSASEALNAAAALVSGVHAEGEIWTNLDALHGDLAYALASAQIKAEKKSAGP